MKGTTTKDELRNIPAGESRTWTMDDVKKCVSVRSMASSLNTYEGMNLATSINVQERTITVTNNAKN